MERWEGKVALVTGASSGIGAAIVEALVRHGMKVVGAARRVERIEALKKKLEEEGAKGILTPKYLDLTKEAEIIDVFKFIKNTLGGVDVMVNSAGVLKFKKILEGTTKEWRETMETNFMSACICTREAIRQMNERKFKGHVINISSVGGHYVPRSTMTPDINVYFSSKFALTAMSQVFTNEIFESNLDIKISNISPGLVKTDISMSFEDLKKICENKNPLEPKDVADTLIFVLGTPPNVLVNDIFITPLSIPF